MGGDGCRQHSSGVRCGPVAVLRADGCGARVGRDTCTVHANESGERMRPRLAHGLAVFGDRGSKTQWQNGSVVSCLLLLSRQRRACCACVGACLVVVDGEAEEEDRRKKKSSRAKLHDGRIQKHSLTNPPTHPPAEACPPTPTQGGAESTHARTTPNPPASLPKPNSSPSCSLNPTPPSNHPPTHPPTHTTHSTTTPSKAKASHVALPKPALQAPKGPGPAGQHLCRNPRGGGGRGTGGGPAGATPTGRCR